MVRPYKKGKWITKDYQELKIEDMKTTHIINTINYLKRRPDFYDVCCGMLCDIDSFDYEDNSHLVEEKIEELKYELRKRGVIK